jgi:NADPH-dependent 7-cyano-7-deazaguanine reductase QueF
MDQKIPKGTGLFYKKWHHFGMSLFDINLVGNPRTDRSYQAKLSTDQPLHCRSADCQVDGHVSLSLTYTPNQQCIETRSFGRYLSHLLQENELEQELLQQIVGDVLNSCHPSSVSLKAYFESTEGYQISLEASHH